MNASGFCIAFGTGTKKLKYYLSILKDFSLGFDYWNSLLFCYLNGIKVIEEIKHHFMVLPHFSSHPYNSSVIPVLQMRIQSLREDKWLSQSHTAYRWADSGLLPPSSQYHIFSLWCNLTDICLKWLLVTDAVVISGEISSPPLFSVSHRSQPQQPSQPQRTLLQHVAQSQTATQTSVVVKSIPASSPGAITHIMQQVVSLLFLPTFCNCLLP